ncbi:MAG: DUF4097 family beta strand repeat protein [Bacteroidales bacterium]|nr:DUF4097 family beta strand repeat protein [Bacteroidales bacterium]
MKALNCKLSLVLVASIFLVCNLQAKEVKKELHKEFSTKPSSVINFDTKFGELVVENWSKDQVVVDVIITADHVDEVKAQKLLDLITVKFETDGNTISVTTKLDNKISKGNFGKKKKFKIFITAKVPTGIEFNLNNNFGSASIQELSGPVNLESNYGKLEVESLLGDETNIEVNYGDLQVGRVTNGSIEINYGKAYIQAAKTIDAEINAGNLRLGTAMELDAEVNMGELIVDKMDPSFKSINIESNMSNIELGIDSDCGFTISAETNMGNIEIPSEMTNLISKKNHKNSSVKGAYGNGQSQITLEGSMGNIEIKLK